MTNLKEISDNIKNKNLKEALRLCEIYNDKKNQHIIFNFKGVIHLIKNDLELSEQYFIKSTEIQPKYEDPIKNLYLVYLKKKLFNKMLVYAKQLVDINELNDEYNYQLAYAHELNNNLGDALKYYTKYLDLNGKNKKQALNNIGLSLIHI